MDKDFIDNEQSETSTTPSVSVLIVWRARPEIAKTLYHNSPYFEACNAEVLVLMSGCEEEDIDRCLDHKSFRFLRVIHIRDNNFNKCRALNIGLAVSRAPVVFILDADIMLDPKAMLDGLATLTGRIFCTIKWVTETDVHPMQKSLASSMRKAVKGHAVEVSRAQVMTLKSADGLRIDQVIYTHDYLTASRGGCGLLFVERKHLIDIGGYDSTVDTWGWEDLDVQVRLKYQLSLSSREVGHVLHLSHDDTKRAAGKYGPAVSNGTNFAYFCSKYLSNHFSGTYETDVNGQLWKEL